jgi:transposase
VSEQEEPSQEQGRGRPTAYDPAYAKQAAKLCELGATDDELADFFEVHRATIYRWKHEHDDFCDAVKTGKDVADERVERSLYQKATGYNVTEQQAVKIKVGQHEEQVEVVEVEKHIASDTTAAIFWLKNRRKDDWRDRKEVDLSGNIGLSGALDALPDD